LNSIAVRRDKTGESTQFLTIRRKYSRKDQIIHEFVLVFSFLLFLLSIFWWLLNYPNTSALGAGVIVHYIAAIYADEGLGKEDKSIKERRDARSKAR
jgi:hypothetical protein